MEATNQKICPICKRGFVAKNYPAIAVCHSCKRVTADDSDIVMNISEQILNEMGYSSEEIYRNGKKGRSVFSRKMITIALKSIVLIDSEKISKMMIMKGRNIGGASVRIMYLSTLSTCGVDKNFLSEVNSFIEKVLDRYLNSTSMAVSIKSNSISNIRTYLVSNFGIDTYTANEHASKILNIAINGTK